MDYGISINNPMDCLERKDFYMMTCMDALGVDTMKDTTVLSDKYTLEDETLVPNTH